MKRCPRCHADYPDDANWCSLDGGKLEVMAPPPSGPRVAPQPGALTMGWDAQPDVSAAATNPSLLAPIPPAPETSSDNAAATARMPQKPGALTMGWDAQPEPASEPSGPRMPATPGALTMGWDVPEEPPATPVSPAALAAQAIETTHEPVTPAASATKSPAGTMLGIQAPWTQSAAQPASGPAGAPSAAGAEHSPATHAPDGTPAMQQPASRSTSAEASSSRATSAEATQRTRGNPDDDLDRPPRNLLPIYALIALVVVGAIIVAIVLATR